MIGEGRKAGKFKQDPNHQITHIHPLHISFVTGGNHSIIQGIINGEGQLLPIEVFDITNLMKVIHFDGKNWIKSDIDKNIGSPMYPEFGWAWEIGRLLSDLRPSPYAI